MASRLSGAVPVGVDSPPASVSRVERNEFARRLLLHERQLHAYIYSMVPDFAAAEEILQDTYLRMFECIGEWQPRTADPDRDLAAWACTIAHYQVLTFRARTRRDRLCFGDQLLERISSHFQLESRSLNARMDALEQCVERLDDHNRELLELAYQGGLSLKQVAETVQRSTAATQRALSRIRSLLKTCVEKSLGSGGRS